MDNKDNIPKKACSQCKKEKNLDYFGCKKGKPRSICKQCIASSRRQKYAQATNKDIVDRNSILDNDAYLIKEEEIEFIKNYPNISLEKPNHVSELSHYQWHLHICH